MSFNSPKKAIQIASTTAVLLAIIKLVGGIMSGSLVVISSAIDSLLDFFVSIVNGLALKKSAKKEDELYNYGYSKIEGFAALTEGVIILISGSLVAFLAMKKYFTGNFEMDSSISLYFMGVSIFFTIFVVYYLNRVAKNTDNLIIKSDALHYKTDLYTNAGIIITIILIKLTGLFVIDLIVSLAISVYIMIGAGAIIKEAYEMLMDKALESSKIKIIKEIIDTSSPAVTSHHFLKTRKSGGSVFIEFHLVFNKEITLFEAHQIGDLIECKIKKEIPNSILTVHLDPLDDSHIDACRVIFENQDTKKEVSA
ncbi:MAG: cation diffusion facilitator family transporter [Candidatus Gracilibacteria bacterium]|nr:cation diffusion facilitator family transporter [Candidatus Gracilibacteria bacterium]